MYQTDLKLKEYKNVQKDLKLEIESLERDVNRLNDEYAYSQTPEAIEKIAREKLKMVKPNEIIYLIKGAEESDDE
jgi:cell division protein FtsB